MFFAVRSQRLRILRLASIEFGEVAAGARSETGLLRHASTGHLSGISVCSFDFWAKALACWW